MPVIHNETAQQFDLPGLAHQTIAGPEHGMKTLEMWKQTIAPGSGTPVHRHACEEAIIVLSGSGRITIEGEETDFGPDSTLQIPHNAIHQIMKYRHRGYVYYRRSGPGPRLRYALPRMKPMPLPWQAQ